MMVMILYFIKEQLLKYGKMYLTEMLEYLKTIKYIIPEKLMVIELIWKRKNKKELMIKNN